jgi:hypothetical protein
MSLHLFLSAIRTQSSLPLTQAPPIESRRASTKPIRLPVKSYDKTRQPSQTKNVEVDSTEPGGRTTAKPDLTLDTRHDPCVIEDHGGLLFTHRNAFLFQLDIRTKGSKLIAPNNWDQALHPGTLALVKVELHVYVLPDDQRPGETKKVCHHS